MFSFVVCLQVFEHPALKRAKRSCKVSSNFVPREKMWIRQRTLEALVGWSARNREYNPFAALYLLAYAFMLRLPSEALPVVAGRADDVPDAQAVLFRVGDTVVLLLKRRQNKPHGSRLVRRCWCRTSPSTCPVHMLGKMLDKSTVGKRWFKDVTPALALQTLRFMLEKVGVAHAARYRTHDLRRGHVVDLQASGWAYMVVCVRGCSCCARNSVGENFGNGRVEATSVHELRG